VSGLPEWIWSFFREKTLVRWSSEVNGMLDISLINGHKVLNTAQTNYSFGSLHRAFRKALRKEAQAVLSAREVLLLGLGAGSVVSILHQEMGSHARITGVEKDPSILAEAGMHFGLREGPELHIVCEDALQFVSDAKGNYDLVIVDLYIGREVPSVFETPAFWEALSHLVSTSGMLVFNKLVYDQPTLNQAAQLCSVAGRYFRQVRTTVVRDRWSNHFIIAENPHHVRNE